MLINLLILAIVAVIFIMVAKKRELTQIVALLFFVTQISFAVWSVLNHGNTVLGFFHLDTLGVTYFVLMSVMGVLTAWSSFSYLDTESVSHCKYFYVSLIMLNVSLAGVYFANNVTVNWIFLEATTLATAGLTYHRRTPRALEATWKYIFVSSVGIAIAYLGVLLLGTVTHDAASMSYASLAENISGGNSLYLKMAFILILVGYSTKLELFPLFTVGIDANHATPTPASAFISSALVGGGFVSIFRVYNVLSGHVEVFSWVQNVLIVTGLLSLIVAAVYMGRTGNYKRLLAYSTVENSGIVALGLGIGGPAGIFAAILHSLAHTLIKGCAFLQLASIGKIYNKYKIGQIGGYFRVDKIGAVALTLVFVSLMAMPPSLLFRSELMIFMDYAASGAKFWVLIPVALALLAVIYWLMSKLLLILYKPCDITKVEPRNRNTPLSVVIVLILLGTIVCGIWMAPQLIELINLIAELK